MTASFTRPLRPDRATKQRTQGIEAAVRVANHPAMAHSGGIARLALGLDQQRNGGDLVPATLQGITVTALQHQERTSVQLNPTTGMRGFIKVQTIQQGLTAGLPQLNQHG